MLNSKSKIVVICGPTASGKTALALKLAKLQPSSLIVVDSRQAYKGLDILTGKDIPPAFVKKNNPLSSYFEHKNTRIWGIDLISPDQTPNLSDFTRFAWKVITREQQLGQQIILVGGTGLYLKAITSPLSQIHVPQLPKLRLKLNNQPLTSLQNYLRKINSNHFNTLNHSDQNNPRRLIRHIEILQTNTLPENEDYLIPQKNSQYYWIGLKSAPENVNIAIKGRVLNRLQNGCIKETKKLVSDYPCLKLPIYTSLGVKYLLSYIKKEINKDELIKRWTMAEIAYSKRQMTWFKKQPQIIWYDKDTNPNIIISSAQKWLQTKV